jgi:hypothetical protein
MVAARMPLVANKDEPPSAYQIRYAGLRVSWQSGCEKTMEFSFLFDQACGSSSLLTLCSKWSHGQVPAGIPKPSDYHIAHLLGCLGRSLLANAGRNDM